MLLHINFNENTNTSVYDYSTNENHAETISNLSITAGDVGYAGTFNGGNSYLIFGDICKITTNELSIFFKLRKHTTGNHTIIVKDNHYKILITSDKIVFSVHLNGNWESITSVSSLSNNTWYTVHCVYGGDSSIDFMAIYIDGVIDKYNIFDSDIYFIDSSTSNLFIGAYSVFFDGDLEQLEIYDELHNESIVLAKHNSPIGIKYQTKKVHGLELADLITGKDVTKQMVVTFKEDTKIFYAIPIGEKLSFVDTILQQGNIYDTNRQYIAAFKIYESIPLLQIKQGITKFSDITPRENILEIGLSVLTRGGKWGFGMSSPTEIVDVLGNVKVVGKTYTPTINVILGIGVTTVALGASNSFKVTGDRGGNTIATITGGKDGQTIKIIFVDTFITITDDGTSNPNTVNLSGAFTSTANDTLTLLFDGISWRELSRSIN